MSRVLLTISEAAKYLSVHPNTLRGWDKKGILKVYRIGTGRHRRFDTEDLDYALIVSGIYAKPQQNTNKNAV